MRAAVLLLIASSCVFAQTPRERVQRLVEAGQFAQAGALAAGMESAARASTIEMAEALELTALSAADGLPQSTSRVRELTGRAIALHDQLEGPDSPGSVNNLAILAEQLRETGDYQAAREILERALGSAAKIAGPDSAIAAEAALGLGNVCLIQSDYARSDQLHRRALSIFERVYGPGDRRTARALRATGEDMTAAGKYGDAAAVYERAASIQESQSPDLAATLVQLANALLRSGEPGRARVVAERAVAICEASVADRLPLSASAYNMLGTVLVQMKDLKGAGEADRRGLAILEKRTGPDTLDVAANLVQLGGIALHSGDPAWAKTYFSRASGIYLQRLGEVSEQAAGCLDNLGQALTLLKDYAGARAALDRALAIQIKVHGERHIWVGNIYQSMAKVAAAAGNYAEAERLLDRNLDIWREQFGPVHPWVATSMSLLADVQAHAGKRDQALETALATAKLRRADVTATVRTVDERRALYYADFMADTLDTALSLVTGARPEQRRAVWDAVIRSRALVLDEMSARRRFIRESRDPELADSASGAGKARAELAAAVMKGKASLTGAAYATLLDDRRAAVDKAEDTLAARSQTARARLTQERAGYDDVAAALPHNAALVAFAHYQWNGVPAYLGFVLHGDRRAPDVIPLGRGARIDALVKAWRAEMEVEASAAGHGERQNEARYRVAGEALRRAVWDPFRSLIAGADSVYVIPDGALEFVNFAALPTGATRYLADAGPLLRMLTAERDLVLPPVVNRAGRLLAIGQPAFGSLAASASLAAVYRGPQSACPDFAKLRFESLPQSGAEVRELAAIWKTGGGQAELLTGLHASEAAVKELAPGARVVHFATHGFFLAPECRATEVARENPLLRAGLALAGANLRGSAPADTEDGILTAEEAASLDLNAAEMVVLSGCDTGIGDSVAGEGVVGLRRAFQEAGARTVVSSLWPVADDEAREWMVAFYRARFVRGLPVPSAARAADLQALATRRSKGLTTHPFHWASFVVFGE